VTAANSEEVTDLGRTEGGTQVSEVRPLDGMRVSGLLVEALDGLPWGSLYSELSTSPGYSVAEYQQQLRKAPSDCPGLGLASPHLLSISLWALEKLLLFTR
jgi:hypothetical protein